MKSVARLDTSGLDKITAQLEPRANVIIKDIAEQIAGEAKQNIGRPGPASHPRPLVDIGTLMSSIKAEPKARLLWWIHDGVEYGIHWELGHIQWIWGRKTNVFRQHPFLIPAVEKFRTGFAAKWSGLFK